MTPPPLIPTRPVSAKVLAPWALFAVLLSVAVVTFFLYADRVPSLMQALADR
jgi:hypothetical protein